ncbi:MAG: cysteine desulfurase family protein [Bacillota bacterium]|nr:cysteine desulfurase [Bacillota bacterium]MDW7729628.1 cysteine desulfurase family protein [Bacillota bacterium]
MKTINLDYSAASPLDKAVLEKMAPFFTEHYGNPSSGHSLGEIPRKAIVEAREQIGLLIGAEARDIILTASASESNNLAIKGLLAGGKKKGNHIISSAIEHFSILNQLKTLQKQGFKVTLLPVDSYGLVDPEDLRKAINEETSIISIQAANPEIGTVQPLEELAAVARESEVIFHTDATAAAGWLPLDVNKTGVDMLTLAGDQFFGPKGSASLFVRRGIRLAPQVEGGIQERGLRAGTENVPAIVGLGEAARLARETLAERSAKIAIVRDELKEKLLSEVPHLHLNGHPEKRLPRNLNISVEFVEGEALLMRLNMAGIMVSSGSSCTSQALKSSHVLAAIGLTPELAQGSLLFTLSSENNVDDIPYITEKLGSVAALLRNMSPLYHQFLKEAQINA